MLVKYDFDANGIKELSKQGEKNAEMLMDVKVIKLEEGKELEIYSDDNESAVLLVSGEIYYTFENRVEEAKRKDCFSEKPYCLHVAKMKNVKIKAIKDSEIILQQTVNEKEFDSVFYTPDDCKQECFGGEKWEGTAKRQVLTVFDYFNAPYSNMVIGEVINLPGRWSSYIPHSHEQPEIYYHKFSKEQGFGASFIGEDVYKVTQGSASIIPGGVTHPQVTAPGYSMYYCWMIRHLDGNPWTDRVDDPQHKWLLDEE